MIEDRLVDLETRVAFDEDSLQELNQVIYRQQAQLDQLERVVDALARLSLFVPFGELTH